MDVRLANPLDAAALKALEDDSSAVPARDEFIDRSLKAGECFVAVADAHIAGYAIFNYSFYDRGFVSLLYVRSDLRRRGIGSALMAHIHRLCRTPTIFTSTNQSNRPMQSLLEKLGYQPSGVIENLDEGDPELVFMKRLYREADEFASAAPPGTDLQDGP